NSAELVNMSVLGSTVQSISSSIELPAISFSLSRISSSSFFGSPGVVTIPTTTSFITSPAAVKSIWKIILYVVIYAKNIYKDFLMCFQDKTQLNKLLYILPVYRDV